MLGEPGRGNQLGYGEAAQSRHDLARERRCVGSLPAPGAHGALVCGILPSSNLGGSSSVCWVSLFGSQAGEHRRGVVPSALCMRHPALCAAAIAVAATSVRELRPAVAAGVWEMWSRRDGLSALAGG
jgi:hypothetical protein